MIFVTLSFLCCKMSAYSWLILINELYLLHWTTEHETYWLALPNETFENWCTDMVRERCWLHLVLSWSTIWTIFETSRAYSSSCKVTSRIYHVSTLRYRFVLSSQVLCCFVQSHNLIVDPDLSSIVSHNASLCWKHLDDKSSRVKSRVLMSIVDILLLNTKNSLSFWTAFL